MHVFRCPHTHTLVNSSERILAKTLLVALSCNASVLLQVHKVMNNYMGIGVDAKVSLEFHTFREH